LPLVSLFFTHAETIYLMFDNAKTCTSEFTSIVISFIYETRRICAPLMSSKPPLLTYTQTWFLFGCQRISGDYEIMMSGYDFSLENKHQVPRAPLLEWKNTAPLPFILDSEKENIPEEVTSSVEDDLDLTKPLNKKGNPCKSVQPPQKGDPYRKRSSKKDRKLTYQVTRLDSHVEKNINILPCDPHVYDEDPCMELEYQDYDHDFYDDHLYGYDDPVYYIHPTYPSYKSHYDPDDSDEEYY
jgi:hypothetical protein